MRGTGWAASIAAALMLILGTVSLGQSRRPYETEVVALGLRGFEPSVLTKSQGKFRLLVQVSPLLPDWTLVLERVPAGQAQGQGHGTAPIATKPVGRGSAKRWLSDQELTPGSYRLSVKEEPNMSMEIRVR